MTVPGAPSPSSSPARWPASSGRRDGFMLIAGLHLAALTVLLAPEYGPFAITLTLLVWAFVNCALLVVLRRPGIAALIAFALLFVLVSLSQFKFGILQLTLTFLDFLIIDRDTLSFLFSVVPSLRGTFAVAVAAAVPLAWLMWRYDPFRVRRRNALAGLAASLMVIAGLSFAVPEQPWEPFQGVNHISNLARSGALSVSHLMAAGWIEADTAPGGAKAAGAPNAAEPCRAEKPPHIVMVLDESSFDITAAPGVRVPPGYRDYFRSADGRQRGFIAEATGGPTWYTEFNVLTGLSARSFGKLRFYVTRIAAGNITRGLPQALRRCGYKTFSLYPTYGNFLSARSFQHGAGVDGFIDMADMGVAQDMQPDSFYFDQALKLIAREREAARPLFVFVYLTANHFPWTSVYRPDLTPGWQPPGNGGEVDEYIRRQTMTARDYRAFLARLKESYPDDRFLLVRFGDHQPAISHRIIEPKLAPGMLARRVMTYDPRYYTTYYAIDGINYWPENLASALPALDAPYLPLVVQEAAGLPLDASFAEQKKIMLRCNGLFYACRAGTEARRFNRLLMDWGLIRNL
ncbi:MAG: LTA synthase family protein [Xanthobacteraceae bacterium]|nr:MAG: LTA synthase family protein [Xanthobacteraceae bacterium]